MSLKIKVPLILVSGVIIFGALVVPFFTVPVSETVIDVFFPPPVFSRQYTWWDFSIEDGSTVIIYYLCDSEINAYLFTENQFNNFQNVGENLCIDSNKHEVSGTITQYLESGGNYVFVISNYSFEDHAGIDSVTVTKTREVKITLLQKITGDY